MSSARNLDGSRPGRLAAPPAEKPHEHRHGGHQHRREAGRDELFAQSHAAVAYQQEARADDGGIAPLANGGPGSALLPARVDDQQGTRQEKARPGHEQRRNGLDGDADSQVGRTPDDVHQAERNGDPGGLGGKNGRGRRGLVRTCVSGRRTCFRHKDSEEIDGTGRRCKDTRISLLRGIKQRQWPQAGQARSGVCLEHRQKDGCQGYDLLALRQAANRPRQKSTDGATT